MERYAHIVGWGKAVPAQVVTNDDLAKRVDTTDGWIRDRTGIAERRIATARETTLTFALAAAAEALQVAQVEPQQLDLVIVCTVTPEYLFPATACLVQDGLGATKAGAFDLEAGCSGFVYGLSVAAAMIRAGQAETVVVIGAETLSRVVDWKDRGTCVLFGDGAGAVVLRGSTTPGGILSTVLGSDGSGGDMLLVPGGGSRNPASPDTILTNQHTLKMNGREVYRFATRVMAQASRQVLEKAKLPFQEVDLLIPHQANVRIIDSAAKALELPSERVFINLDRYGNTSAASIPIALCEAIAGGRVRPGDHLVLVGFGAGLTWGACALEWTQPTLLPPTDLPTQARGRLRAAWTNLKTFGSRVLRRVDTTVNRVLDKIEKKEQEI